MNKTLVGLLALCLSVGCMYTPEDGDVSGSIAPDEDFRFEGYTGIKARTVEVYANTTQSMTGASYVGSDVSNSTKTGTIWGLNGYKWSLDATVPEAAWDCTDKDTAFTWVKGIETTSSPDADLKTMVQNHTSCYYSGISLGDFLDDCVSNNSPWAKLTSNDASTPCTCAVPNPAPITCSGGTPFACQIGPDASWAGAWRCKASSAACNHLCWVNSCGANIGQQHQTQQACEDAGAVWVGRNPGQLCPPGGGGSPLDCFGANI